MTRHAQIEWLCGLWSFAAPVRTWRVMPRFAFGSRADAPCVMASKADTCAVGSALPARAPLRDETEADRHDELGERMRVRLGIDAPIEIFELPPM